MWQGEWKKKASHGQCEVADLCFYFVAAWEADDTYLTRVMGCLDHVVWWRLSASS